MLELDNTDHSCDRALANWQRRVAAGRLVKNGIILNSDSRTAPIQIDGIPATGEMKTVSLSISVCGEGGSHLCDEDAAAGSIAN